ncbi:MAG: site-specific integrase [Verrucomicrobiota bacterium]
MVKRYILFYSKQHPSKLGPKEVKAFLEHLAIEQHVAPSTQNQAFHALTLVYEKFLRIPLGNLSSTVRARSKNRKLPKILSRELIYTHVTKKPGFGIQSPMDDLHPES